MSDETPDEETAIAKPLTIDQASPEKLGKLTDEEAQQLSLNADRDLRRHFAEVRDGRNELHAIIHKVEQIDGAVTVLNERRAQLAADLEDASGVYQGRANHWLARVTQYINLVLRAGHRKPPTKHPFPSGTVTYKKQRTTTEWADADAVLDALREADLPLEALQQCTRTKVELDKKFVGDHLEDREDGQWFVWVDVGGGGEVFEAKVSVVTGEGETAQHSPLRKTIQPEPEYIIQATPREDSTDD